MPSLVQLYALCAQLCLIGATPVTSKRHDTTAVVHWSCNTGTPQHYAAGILNGIPDAANQIPDHFYTDIDLQYVRAGGAQVPAPGRGWIWGEGEYENRFASILSNYRTARQHKASFVFLPHDLWGADTTQNSTAPFPGDNGDWAYYDEYLARLFSDMKASSMVDGLVWDIWNEADLDAVFWGRSQDQYLQMWGRTHAKVKQAFPDMIISGPSSASAPAANNTWYTNFASFVKANGTEPDQWSWHMETGGNSSMNVAYAAHQAILAQYGLSGGSTPVNINEYGVFQEQVAAGAAWWIAQLERANAFGLRGNWLSKTQLHDFLASLLSKPGAPEDYSPRGTGYYPNGEFQVYKYYATNMTGTRVATNASSDLALDVYATYDDEQKKARVLVGNRQVTGTWYVQLNDLTSLGLPSSGMLNVLTRSFVDNGHMATSGRRQSMATMVTSTPTAR